MEEKKNGRFVISLDFELMWGMRDVTSIEKYGENIKGVHQALPELLQYFKRFGIRATFATVGFVFFKTKKELLTQIPELIPQYNNLNLSPYGDYINSKVGNDALEDPYHFAPDLIELIKNTPNQEIASHTFSHFYCLEKGQSCQEFESDLKSFIEVAQSRNLEIHSIIFPRNQINENYLKTCSHLSIKSYRSSEQSWVYESRSLNEESHLRRFIRLLDAYINITGHHCYDDVYMNKKFIADIPSSRFLRPYSPTLKYFEKLRLKRIKKSMEYAAINGLTYHIWWHPHNFGIHQAENFYFLNKILEYYSYLNEKYNFKSYTMAEVADQVLKSNQ